jgi:aminopeptidase N
MKLPHRFGPVALLFVLAAIVAAPCTAEAPPLPDHYPHQNGIDAQHYVFRLTLSDTTNEIQGVATVTLRFVTDSVSRFWLDFASPADSGKGMTVVSVTSDGHPVDYAHDNDRLTITLPSAPAAGELRSFTVTYHGIPADGLRIGKDRYGERSFYSWNWPNKARQWLPMIDHPSDKATSEFIVTAPDHYQVVANGRLVEVESLGNGMTMTHWSEGEPIASWLNALGVAQFDVRHFARVYGTPLETWVSHNVRDEGEERIDDAAKRAFEYFSENIGPFDYEKLAHVQAAFDGGGTEHASEIFYGERGGDGLPSEGVIVHESAHQWFGDAVTESDWNDVWLSEGFATYFTHLYYEHVYGHDVFKERMRHDRDIVLQAEQRFPDATVVHADLTDMTKVLQPSRIIYQKGAWVLNMLRHQVGTDTWWKGIRAYYKKYRNGNTSTERFRRAMEEASGQDLGWFFQQWLHRSQSPSIDGTWHYDKGAKQVVVELRQTQDGGPYRLPKFEIGVREPGQALMKIDTVDFSTSKQTFRLAAAQAPDSVALDPEVWTLMRSTFRKR